ncbi:MAG: hypothetical protein M1835_003278 [Candelina submexicana]|nr:MAG: hypothetical protein M1835_003278 [Candelina submexicana]
MADKYQLNHLKQLVTNKIRHLVPVENATFWTTANSLYQCFPEADGPYFKYFREVAPNHISEAMTCDWFLDLAVEGGLFARDIVQAMASFIARGTITTSEGTTNKRRKW